MSADEIEQRIAVLKGRRVTLRSYLEMKVEEEDFHGVCDAAMDLRDIDCELDGLRYALEESKR